MQCFRQRCFVLLVIAVFSTYFLSLYLWCFRLRHQEETLQVKLNFSTTDKPKLGLGDFARDAEKYVDSLKGHRRHSTEFIKRHQNDDVIFFNKIPKTGSEMMVLLMQWLQKENQFRHIRLKNTVRRFLNHDEQLELAAEIGDKISGGDERIVSFDRHIHFTNFTQLGLKMPILINIIRNPVEKLASRFYYARVTPRPGGFTPPHYTPPKKVPFVSLEECLIAESDECIFIDGQEYDLTIPYFCGHQKYCRELNNVAAFLTAKRNADEWYPVIGVLEELNATLAVFESTLPKIFRGVTDLYFEELHGFHHNKNRQRIEGIADWAWTKLKKNLSLEFEFYNFVRQRLQNQYSRLTLSMS